MPKYAYRAKRNEIEENEFNLNIPRYVDTFEEEAEIDIAALQEGNRRIGGGTRQDTEGDEAVSRRVGGSLMRTPPNWTEITIGAIAELGSGTTPSRSMQAEYFDGGNIPWVKTGDLNNEIVRRTEKCITEKAQ